MRMTVILLIVGVVCGAGRVSNAQSAAAKNPILGKWAPKVAPGQLASANDLELTEKKITLGNPGDGNVFDASYAISGKTITVTTGHPIMKKMVCTMQSETAMTCDMPLMGKTIYQLQTPAPKP